MNSLNDLRDALDRHAELAPDSFGLVEQAQTGAARIRRRRRLAQVGVGAAAVLVVATATPVLVQSHRPAPQVAAPADARTATQFTLGVAPGSGVTLYNLQSNDRWQSAFAVIQPAGSGGKVVRLDRAPIQVTAHDPGTFDPTRLRLGAPTTVRGLPAWFSADYLEHSAAADATELGVTASTLLGWQDPSGAWLTMSPLGTHSPGSLPVDEKTRTALTTIAEAVRIGPVREISMPYRLGWLPPGVRVDAVRPIPATESPESHVRLDGTRTAASTGSGKPAVVSVPIIIETVPTTSSSWTERRGSAYVARSTVAGHPAWYQPLGDSTAPSTLAVEVGNCGFIINVWRDGISFAEQERMVAALTVADCATPATWIPLLR